MCKETFLPIGVAIVTLQRKLWPYQIRIATPCSYFSSFRICWLAFRGSPAETRLTVYCWLLVRGIPAQSVGSGNLPGNLGGMFCAQTWIARDPVITFECRSDSDNNICPNKLSGLSALPWLHYSESVDNPKSELQHHVHISRVLGHVGLVSGVPQQKLGWQFTAGC